MYATVNAEFCYTHARQDIREHLGWQGVKDIFEYFETLESCNEHDIAYDPSLFWGWIVGKTPAELLSEFNPSLLKEVLTNNTFADDWDRDEAILDELREHGSVVLGDDRYYFNEEI